MTFAQRPMPDTVLGVPKGAYLNLFGVGVTVATGGAGCALAVSDPAARTWLWIAAALGVALCLVVLVSAAIRRAKVSGAAHPADEGRAAEPLPIVEVKTFAELPGRRAPPPAVYVSPPPPAPTDPRVDFVEKRLQVWIEKLRETQARNGQELDTRVGRIGVLLGRVFGTDSEQRRNFRRAPDINAEPMCAHRLERKAFTGTDLQYRAEVFIRALERIRRNMSAPDIQRDFEPWDGADPEINP